MLCISVLLMSTFAVTAQEVDASDEPLVMIESYFVNQRSFGIKHPRMRQLRERIEDVTDNDFQFDLAQVQNRLEKLTSDRRLLLQSRGLTHPDLFENATRLSLMSRLLAGQSAAVLRDISETRK